jgi:hypothetical protein
VGAEGNVLYFDFWMDGETDLFPAHVHEVVGWHDHAPHLNEWRIKKIKK